MSKTNYNRMSSKTNSTEDGTIIGVDLASEPDITVETEVFTEELIGEPIPASKLGVVTCAMLNVRKKPSIKAEVLTIISEGTEVDIDSSFEHKEFYKVSAATTADTIFSGYCMKKFIQVK